MADVGRILTSTTFRCVARRVIENLDVELLLIEVFKKPEKEKS